LMFFATTAATFFPIVSFIPEPILRPTMET
jgi:hypothetical protein